MKTTYAYASIALALMSCENVVAHSHHYRSPQNPIVTLSVSATATSSAYPTGTVPANSTNGGSPITAGTCNDCSGVCVTFGATNPDLWYWWNGGPNGDPSTFGDKPIGSVCLTQAGAMFVGSSKGGDSGVASGGANTKFEWSVDASTSNFDVSICDGFSVPMICTGFGGNESPYTTIGGGELCQGACAASDQNGPNCRNLGAHTPSADAVPSCFKEGAGEDGKSGENNYWLNDNVSVQAIFTGRTDVVCTVGDLSSKAKREIEESAAELSPRASKHRHQRRAHGHGAHAIS